MGHPHLEVTVACTARVGGRLPRPAAQTQACEGQQSASHSGVSLHALAFARPLAPFAGLSRSAWQEAPLKNRWVPPQRAAFQGRVPGRFLS